MTYSSASVRVSRARPARREGRELERIHAEEIDGAQALGSDAYCPIEVVDRCEVAVGARDFRLGRDHGIGINPVGCHVRKRWDRRRMSEGWNEEERCERTATARCDCHLYATGISRARAQTVGPVQGVRREDGKGRQTTKA